MSRWAAEFIVSRLNAKPDLLLCASAGGTPTGTYAGLAASHQRSPNLWKKFRVVQIDEWGGLPLNHPATCRTDLKGKLLEPLKINGARFKALRSDAANPQRECEGVARWLRTHGPIDVCVLGLGINGHVAMNEPGTEVVPHAHVARLAPQSLKHGMLQKLARKPRYGLTLGMADILQSRSILLVVSGRAKQQPMKQLLTGRVSTRFPAGFLWLHPDVTILCDRDAIPNSL